MPKIRAGMKIPAFFYEKYKKYFFIGRYYVVWQDLLLSHCLLRGNYFFDQRLL